MYLYMQYKFNCTCDYVLNINQNLTSVCYCYKSVDIILNILLNIIMLLLVSHTINTYCCNYAKFSLWNIPRSIVMCGNLYI